MFKMADFPGAVELIRRMMQQSCASSIKFALAHLPVACEHSVSVLGQAHNENTFMILILKSFNLICPYPILLYVKLEILIHLIHVLKMHASGRTELHIVLQWYSPRKPPSLLW